MNVKNEPKQLSIIYYVILHKFKVTLIKGIFVLTVRYIFSKK